MKVVIDGFKFKFKKKNAAEFYCWLSDVVHLTAALKKFGVVAVVDDEITFYVPDCARMINQDGEDQNYFLACPDRLPELKKARRELALLSKVIL